MKITVKAIPNAKKAEVKEQDGVLRVKIDLPPIDGKANKRLIEILAEYFSIPKSRIKIIRGGSSKNKVIEILE